MTNHNFENKISEKLNQFEIEPSEGLLDLIFEKRAAKSKSAIKLPFAKLAIFAVVATLISIGIFHYLNNQKPEIAKIDNLNSETVISEKMNKTENKTSLADNKTDANSSNSETLKSKADTKVKSNLKVDNTSTFTNKTKNENMFKLVQTNLNKTTKSGASSQVVNISKKEKISETNSLTSENSENLEARYFDIFNKNRPVLESEQHKGKSHLYIYQTASDNYVSSLNINTLTGLKHKMFPTKELALSKVELVENLHKLDYNKPTKKPIFIDFLFSPGLSFFKPKDAGNNFQNINKSRYNQQFGVRISVPISKRINVFSGVNMAQQENLYKGIITENSKYTSIRKLTGYINDPVRGVIPFSYQDTSYVNKTTSTKYNFTNAYKLLQIPLGLSYNFGFKKFDFAVNASSLINIYTNSQGHNIDFEKQQTSSFKSNKKNIGLGACISFMTAYRFNNRFKFIVEPSFNFYKIKAQNYANQMSESVLNNFLTVGLRYNLF